MKLRLLLVMLIFIFIFAKKNCEKVILESRVHPPSLKIFSTSSSGVWYFWLLSKKYFEIERLYELVKGNQPVLVDVERLEVLQHLLFLFLHFEVVYRVKRYCLLEKVVLLKHLQVVEDFFHNFQLNKPHDYCSSRRSSDSEI